MLNESNLIDKQKCVCVFVCFSKACVLIDSKLLKSPFILYIYIYKIFIYIYI